MVMVGFHGGHSIYELDAASDVSIFFELIDVHVAQVHVEQDWRLLSDRLYRRYLRQEELGAAVELMDKVRDVFSTLPGSLILEKKCILGSGAEARLDPSQPTLADVFSKYFDSFAKACGSALSFMDRFKIYQPVKTVISDQPWFLLESQRPLDEYNVLEGNPFWLR